MDFAWRCLLWAFYEMLVLCLPVRIPRPDLDLIFLIDAGRRRPLADTLPLAILLAGLASLFEAGPLLPRLAFYLLVLWASDRALRQLSVGAVGSLLLTAALTFLLPLVLGRESGPIQVILNGAGLALLARLQLRAPAFRGRKYGWIAEGA